MLNKNILIVLPSKDFNSEEYLIIKNTFEKNSFKIFISSDSNALCLGENGIKVKADVSIFNIQPSNFAAVVFIGGNGVRKYWDDKSYQRIAILFLQSNKIVGAICAAPIILSNAGLLGNKNATCFPSDKKDFEKGNLSYHDANVVVDGKIVTGQSSSISVEFAQTIIHKLKNS